MKKILRKEFIFLNVALITILFAFSNLLAENSSINKLYEHFNLNKQKDLIVFIGIKQCYSCNSAKITGIIKEIKEYLPDQTINFIAETDNKNDFDAFKKVIPKNVRLFEYTDPNINQEFNSNALFMFYDKSINGIAVHKFRNIADVKLYLRYIIPDGNIKLANQYKIPKKLINYSSDIILLNKSDANFTFLDKNSEMIITFDNNGKVIQSNILDDLLKVTKGKDVVFDSLLNSGQQLHKTIVSAQEIDDSHLNIIYLITSNISTNSIYSVLVSFDGNSIENIKMLGQCSIRNNYFYKNTHIFYLDKQSELLSDKNCVVYCLGRAFQKYDCLVSRSTLDTYLLDQNTYKWFDNFLFDNEYLYGFYSDSLKIFMYNSKDRWCRLELRARFDFYNNYKVHDMKIIGDNYIIVLSDDKHLYFQIYDLNKAVLVNEFITDYKKDGINDTKLIDFRDNNFSVLTKYNKTGWFLEKYEFSLK